MLDIFHTLAEVSVAITGFSSLIIIFRGSSVAWSTHDFIHFGFVLAWSIGCIFLALLPVLLAEFGFTVVQAARAGLIAIIVYVSIVGGLLTRAQTVASRRESRVLPLKPRLTMTLLVMAMMVTALLSSFDLLGGPVHAWYAFCIILLLVIATADLGIFVVESTRERSRQGETDDHA
jgi:hypothetical protein